jgi:O-antigen/teichoic acid export membrane protein
MSSDPAPLTPAPESPLESASRRGAPLVIAGHLASQLIGLATLAILCRLLKPADYGLLSVVLPAVMLPRMAATLGPGITVMQRKDLTSSQLSVLFWLQLLAGAFAAAITCGICAILAASSTQPNILALGAALAGGTLFAALGNQHQALLERDLRFGKASALRLAAQFIACALAIGYALWRPDVWALVVLHVMELAALALGSWLLISWRPIWPQRPWRVRDLTQFSASYSASSLLQFLAQNMEKILLPIMFGAECNRALGLYAQGAYNLMIKPVYLLTTPLTGVMVSSLAKTQPGSAAQTELATRFFRLCALGLFPAAVGLALVSDDVVLLLGGEQWRDAGLLLKWLAPSIVGIGLMNLAIFVLAARGAGRALLMASLWLVILTVQATGVGAYVGSKAHFTADEPAYGAAVGFAAAFTLLQVAVWTGPFVWFALRSAEIPPRRVFAALIPAAAAAAVMGLVVAGLQWLLPRETLASHSLRLLIFIPAGVVVYSLLMIREIAALRRATTVK